MPTFSVGPQRPLRKMQGCESACKMYVPQILAFTCLSRGDLGTQGIRSTHSGVVSTTGRSCTHHVIVPDEPANEGANVVLSNVGRRPHSAATSHIGPPQRARASCSPQTAADRVQLIRLKSLSTTRACLRAMCV